LDRGVRYAKRPDARGGVPLPARAAVTGDVPLQACPNHSSGWKNWKFRLSTRVTFTCVSGLVPTVKEGVMTLLRGVGVPPLVPGKVLR
jgi:hypothetical protein